MASSVLRGFLQIFGAFAGIAFIAEGVSAGFTVGDLFQIFEDIEIEAPCIIPEFTLEALSACAIKCKSLGSCRAGSYNGATRRCCLSSLLVYETGATYTKNRGSVYFQGFSETDTVRHENWTLVFRVEAGSGHEAYAGWTDVGRYDDHWVGRTDMNLGCVSTNASTPCNTLFRSYLLDNWGTLGIQKVRLSVFKKSLQVVNLVFDGRGSGFLDWFSPNRVLESPWRDLTQNNTYNSFSIAGIEKDSRRFFINSRYGSCSADFGWLLVVDSIAGRTSCAYENYPLPVVLYSGSQELSNWKTSVDTYGRADVFAVFVQF